MLLPPQAGDLKGRRTEELKTHPPVPVPPHGGGIDRGWVTEEQVSKLPPLWCGMASERAVKSCEGRPQRGAVVDGVPGNREL